MKKYAVLLASGLMCMSLSACQGTEFDPAAVENMTRTIEDVTSSVNDMQVYIGDIQAAVEEGINSTNAVMEWYKTDAWANNPWISTPVTEEEVENLIKKGQEEVNSYLGENATYDIISQSDVDFFNEYFADPSANGFLLSTYESPEACDIYQVLKRDEDIIKKLGVDERDVKGSENLVGRISETDVDKVLTEHLGITNEQLKNPIVFSKGVGQKYLYLGEKLDCKDLVCNGGFYYNNLYVIMMNAKGANEPFALTALSKLDDGSIRIHMNYWSEDMSKVNWDGSFIYDLYDLMQTTDLQKIISIPGMDGDISLGTVIDAASSMGISGEDIIAASKLVSDVKDKAKTYMQEFDGYRVYYSNLDPKAVEEFVVSQIDVTSGDYMTAEGIGIGATLDEVKKVYGDGLEAKFSGGMKQLFYNNGKYDMVFILDKAGEVEEMIISLVEEEPVSSETVKEEKEESEIREEQKQQEERTPGKKGK
ncbi:MAG: hypothetical protein K6E98_12690 [Lachnospiraceae bacterium]|nr:hypothetical protein [Lachnospiraceae bacterium]